MEQKTEKKKRWRPSLTAYRALQRENEGLKEKLDMAERSNKYMEDERKRRNAIKDNSKRIIDELKRELEYIKNRGFWARVFNR